MNLSAKTLLRALGLLGAAATLAALPGCLGSDPVTPGLGPQVSVTLDRGTQNPGPECSRGGNPAPPGGVTTVTFAGRTLRMWPFVDRVYNGTGEDPINLVFVGQADPRQIRAALLALDGNRTAYGFPDAYPFNARWSDANGDAMVAFGGTDGWVGSVVQLQLGNYAPVRAHLRLFRTGSRFQGGQWTLGNAHFEVMIPGTADHQVLSWELAEQLVVVDMMRSGLLSPTQPVGSTGPINPSPYREIPDVIYNQLPPELIAAIGGPAQPASGPVPIATDGRATILNVEKAAKVAPDVRTENLTFTYDQVIPKPICNASGAQWVLVQGPVTFKKTARVDAEGGYRYQSSYAGTLTILPLDLTQSPPVPAGAPYQAQVGEDQEGWMKGTCELMLSDTRRVAAEPGGSEFLITLLKEATHGPKIATSRSHCLTPGS